MALTILLRPLRHLLFYLYVFVALASAAPETQRFTFGYVPAESGGKPSQCGSIVGTPITQNSPSQPDKVATRLIWSVESYTSPRKEAGEWARLGLLDAGGKAFNGSTSLASMAALRNPTDHAALLYLQLDANDLPESVSFRATQEAKSGMSEKDTSLPKLVVMTSAPEPRPVLNRPVILNSAGKVDEPPKEKTLLQKYWWVGAIVLAMSMMGGGEAK